MNNGLTCKRKTQIACVTMWGNWRERMLSYNRPYTIYDGYVAIYES